MSVSSACYCRIECILCLLLQDWVYRLRAAAGLIGCLVCDTAALYGLTGCSMCDTAALYGLTGCSVCDTAGLHGSRLAGRGQTSQECSRRVDIGRQHDVRALVGRRRRHSARPTNHHVTRLVFEVMVSCCCTLTRLVFEVVASCCCTLTSFFRDGQHKVCADPKWLPQMLTGTGCRGRGSRRVWTRAGCWWLCS